MAEKTIAYVILTWNSEEYIEKCLQSIIQINGYIQRIIIVDNGSKDETVSILKQYVQNSKSIPLCNIEYIPLYSNKGTTISRNIGLRHIIEKTNYICILDSDTIINQKAVDRMTEILDSDSKNGIVGPLMYTSDGIEQVSGRHIPTAIMKILKVLPGEKNKKKALAMDQYNNKDNVYPVGYLMSACWMIKSKAFEQVGMLDEKIFYAPEDVEYCIRMWVSGWRVLYCRDAEIIHEWQRLSRKKIFSKHNYEHIKGLIYLFNKYKFFISNKKIEKLVK